MTIDYEQRAAFTRELPVTLNEHELQQYGRMLAEKVREEELTEERKKQENAAWTTKIKIIRQDIKRIADARAKGEELRPVPCAERLHGNVIEIVRLDRDEVVDTRPADLRDLQTTIPNIDVPGEPPEGKLVPFSLVPPIEEGPEELGPNSETEERSDEPQTGVVRDDEGHLLGEGVETSAGDVAYISGDTLCEGCGDPVTDDDETAQLTSGATVHKRCLADEEWTDGNDAPLGSVDGLATIGEQLAAKNTVEDVNGDPYDTKSPNGPPPKKKRERSKKANEAKSAKPSTSPKKKK